MDSIIVDMGVIQVKFAKKAGITKARIIRNEQNDVIYNMGRADDPIF
jgi:hypothetical protein